jgi:hypothetical protein
MAQPADHPAAGGLLHHLLTLTLSGGHSLLPTPAVANSFYFRKWGALCCPDFPPVIAVQNPMQDNAYEDQRQTGTLLSACKSNKYFH